MPVSNRAQDITRQSKHLSASQTPGLGLTNGVREYTFRAELQGKAMIGRYGEEKATI
jgi:hypothetical protein